MAVFMIIQAEILKLSHTGSDLVCDKYPIYVVECAVKLPICIILNDISS